MREEYEAVGTAPPRPPLDPSCLRRGLAAGMGLLLTLGLLPPGAGQAADLFTPVTEASASPPSDDLTLRSRMVTIDFTQLQRARAVATSRQTLRTTAAAPRADRDRVLPQSPRQGVQAGKRAVSPRADSGRVLPEPRPALTFNLFDDVVVTAIVEHTAPTYSGGYSVSGRLVNEPLSTLTLVVNGETVAGTVRRVGETYHIRSVGEGRYAISEVAESPLNCGVDALHAGGAHPH